MNGPEEYALSKDLDVALWIDFRAFHGKPELVNVIDFVIVNCRLHDEFDQFKKAEVQSSYSLLPVVELLLFYCLTKCPMFWIPLKCINLVGHTSKWIHLKWMTWCHGCMR